jgi:Flp pilus assembly protein TadG
VRCEARPARDGGYATAETAVALPTLVLLAAALLWAVLAADAQIRCVDAAREAARAAARGDPAGEAEALARRLAPSGADVRLATGGGVVRVEVSASTVGPGAMGAALSLDVSATAVADLEEGVEGAKAS